MNRTLFFLLILLWACSSVLAEEDPLGGYHRSLRDEAFVVETDDDSVSDSLNRISGDIDLGFSTPEQSYESSDHYRAGPFGRAQAMDQAE